MIVLNGDPFELYRLLLGTVCTIYATVVTVRSLWGWLVYFSGSDPSTRLLRRYTVATLVRLRFRRFGWEFAQIGLELAALALLLNLHQH